MTEPREESHIEASNVLDKLPEWVGRLDAPVWVRGTDGMISFMNEKAARLLGVDAAECIGLPCYTIVGGLDVNGEPVCGCDCHLAQQAETGAALEPVLMRVPGTGKHIKVVAIPVGEQRETPMLVHCAVDLAREYKMSDYIRRVAQRSAAPLPGDVIQSLTPREQEILRLLARDQTLRAIAEQLGISYTTVRNHVQHMLPKLGVHSIPEGVAKYLLTQPED